MKSREEIISVIKQKGLVPYISLTVWVEETPSEPA